MQESVRIPLTQGQSTLIDAADFSLVSERKWWAVRAGTGKFYATTQERIPDGSLRALHMQRFLCGEPQGIHVDHANGDTLDNRRDNLRLATRSQNKANGDLYRSNTSGYKGVSWNQATGKWTARVGGHKKRLNMGSFASPEEAARAYDVGARALYGEFAKLNFP